jgi:DNA helicase-2/ATP-dependent DNA helicase PcrA
VISDLKQNWYDSHQNESIENRYNESSADINIGDTIIHTAFGEGLVISKKDDFIEIIFKAPYGHKTLNAKHKAIRLKN